MATWKEKGEVPDSDEEDSLDSQSLAGFEIHNEERHDNPHRLDDLIEEQEHEEEESREEHLKDGQPTSSANEIATTQLTRPLATQTVAQDRFIFPPSSPDSPKLFKAPQTFWELEEDEDGPPAAAKLSEERTTSDEISKSYVRITSPTSSILSSLPASQLSLPPNVVQNVSKSGLPAKEDLSAGNVQGTSNFGKRSLRQRNPIQLHPYIVEQERYQRTLKARGVAPIRLVQSQDKSHSRSRDTASPDPDSQRDSQDVEFETGESQQMDFNWDPPLSSSPQRPAEDHPNTGVMDEDVAMRDDDDDDEFPDIDELLREPKRFPSTVERKGRTKTYSSKSKRPLLSKIQTESAPRLRDRRATTDIFNVPASPPTTSPPFPTTSRHARQSLSRTASNTSKEPTPIRFNFNERGIAADLPTPVTSAAKAGSGPVLIQSDSDDPFASDVEAGSLASSSDESVQIRKVSKKIRGVLPASHLRLDQQQKKTKPAPVFRNSLSLSPAKTQARRGVALPRFPGNPQSPSVSTDPIAFLSDDSEEEDEENQSRGFIMEDDTRLELDSLFTQSRIGFAEEDDRIDAMLPSLKRHITSSNNPRKKQRLGSSSLYGKGKLQPKITGHLSRPRQSTAPSSKPSRKPKHPSIRRQPAFNKAISQPRSPAPPRLSILDIAHDPGVRLPQFIKVAARAARSRKRQGRQSPSRKFIRLSNREDTQDVQSVLDDWKGGRIKPKVLSFERSNFSDSPEGPLQPIQNNRQTRLRSPESIAKPSHRNVTIGNVGLPRKLVVSRGKQRSMNDFVSKEYTAPQFPGPISRHNLGSILLPRRERARYQHPLPRPAQLESYEVEYSSRNPATAFKTTKRALDVLYRAARKRPVPQANLQLSRFLADEDVVRPSVENEQNDAMSKVRSKNPFTNLIQISQRRKKRSPQRIDAGAAMYRQPSDPLILEYLAPAQLPNLDSEGSKLLGLAKFGTNYPCNFDILPLQPGVFFHESTLIGSGRLAEVLKGIISPNQRPDHPPASLQLADKTFCWESWDENASSEVGLCFDWILDQLIAQDTPVSSPRTHAIAITNFVYDYVLNHLNFAGKLDQSNFLSRMKEVLEEFSSRIAANQGMFQDDWAKEAIEMLSMVVLLTLRLLQMAHAQQGQDSLTYEIEDLLKALSAHLIKTLMDQGLDGIRKLYDDLQYLSYRERGIRNDQYAVQGWVVVIKVLQAAKIPRGSFWDVTNSKLIDVNVKDIRDARMMEKLWYSMFSLLPLCEFDEFGVVISGQRQEVSFENWMLPQLLSKRVFELYSLNPRQFPGFNDYCRSIVGRCHHLMVEWGWWKCSGVIGTLFDFFASQNLSHLRNEEAYTSPRFLEELATEPSLAVELEDRCFHIFLKLVALSIQHFRLVGDDKNIRNLVARLLPNHNRQYPKEESVHQRDLASLRNHHDLLCTLFWSAPPELRPALSLLQELVIADRSHKEACLINLRAWENLACFILTHTQNPEAFESFTAWQNTFSTKLLQQYFDTESEVRQQADALSKTSKEPITEAQLEATITANETNTLLTLQRVLVTIRRAVAVAPSSELAKVAFNNKVILNIISTITLQYTIDQDGSRVAALRLTHLKNAGFNINVHALKRAQRMDKQGSIALISELGLTIKAYTDRVDILAPSPPVTNSDGTSGESQDSEDLVQNLERMSAIEALDPLVLPLAAMMKGSLSSPFPGERMYHAFHSLVVSWAHVVAMVTEYNIELRLRDFLLSGSKAVFESHHNNSLIIDCVSDLLWPVFLVELLSHTPLWGAAFKAKPFDVGSEWMTLMSQPSHKSVHLLTRQLYTQKHPLVPHQHESQYAYLATAIKKIHSITRNQSTVTLGLGDVSLREAQDQYAAALNALLALMQSRLEVLVTGTPEHTTYQEFVRKIVTDIRAYGSTLQRRLNLDYFLRDSTHYTPSPDDPVLYGAGIISYSNQLDTTAGCSQLFHYLYNGWSNAQQNDQLDRHVVMVRHAMVKNWEIAKFVLTEYVPAILLIGDFDGGWLLAASYLPAVSAFITSCFQMKHARTDQVFAFAINILKVIMNTTVTNYRRFAFSQQGIDRDHRGILSVVHTFSTYIFPQMYWYASSFPQLRAQYEEVGPRLANWIHMAIQSFHCTDTMEWQIAQRDEFEVEKSPCLSGFVEFVTNDIKDRWIVNGWAVTIRDVRVSHKMAHWHNRLQVVLQKGLPFYEGSQRPNMSPEDSLFLMHDWSGRFVPDTN